MPFNGAGLYTPPGADFPAVPNTLIESSHFNNIINDLATALSLCITKDGQQTVLANIPMNSFVFTGLGTGLASRTRSANTGDVQDGLANWVIAGGTVDAITATYSPALTALVDGQICFLRALGANTITAPTFAPNALPARAITRNGGGPLAPDDIPGALAEIVLRYNLANTRWELLNPTTNVQTTRFTSNPLINGKLVRSVAGNALTVALKDLAGNDPSAVSPVYVVVPTQTAGVLDGGYTTRKVSAALSTVVSSGSTLGHTNAVASPVYTYFIDNAGTIEIGNATKFFGYASVQSSTAEGGVGGADTATVLYSTAARVSMAVVCAQRWKSTQAAAGTWLLTTGEVQLAPFPYKAPIRTKITAAGVNTYTAPWDMLDAEIIITGGGGSGAGALASAAGQVSTGGGGAAAGTAIVSVSAALLTGNNTVTIGAKGAGVNGALGNAGVASSAVNAAGTTLAAASGGGGGQLAAAAAVSGGIGGIHGVGTTGDLLLAGGDGFSGNGAVNIQWGGNGGTSYWGGGARCAVNGVGGGAASDALAYGSGGNGSMSGFGGGGSAAQNGGVGVDGVCVITERY